jgi:hypothetical protein
MEDADGVNYLCEILGHKLTNWPTGDLRPAAVYVRPDKQMLDIHPSWHDQRIAVCPISLKAHRCPKSGAQNSVHAVIQGLQTISESSGFGEISITPKHKAQSIKGHLRFEVVWIVTCHTQI